MSFAATLGFEPPLASLRFWILGASDPASDAQESLDGQQRLARLQQGGWQVDYADYVLVQQQWLPRRLTVTRGSLRLRVVVDGWHRGTCEVALWWQLSCERADLVAGAGQTQPVPARDRSPADGYHDLQTIFQLIERCDRIGLTLREDGAINAAPAWPMSSRTRIWRCARPGAAAPHRHGAGRGYPGH
jgi:hypothetical protein